MAIPSTISADKLPLDSPYKVKPNQTFGCPATYNPDVVFPLVLQRIELGDSLVKVCNSEGFPSYAVVCNWLHDRPDFQEKYRASRRLQAQFYEGKAQEIVMAATPATAHVARVQFDWIRWATKVLDPKVYGDRPAEITVNNTTNVLVVNEDRRAQLMERRRLLTSAKAAVVVENES